MSDYPRVLYHTAIERPRDRFGKLIEGAAFHHVGDMISPNYPIPNTVVNAQGLRGRQLGQGSDHTIAQHHYKTILVAKYFDNGAIDPEASLVEEERLSAEGWVRHPDMLKEEYDEE